MRALAIRRYKAQMETMDLPRPEPGPRDLLVRVRAAGVNPLDYKIREGVVKVLTPYTFPLILGTDLAGDVEAIGPGVTRFKVGDAIYARLDKERIGAIAEYALVREGAAAKKPARLDYVQAASLPLVGLTAWQALIEVARLQAGQKILIHAGSGGVVVTIGGRPDGKFARAWGLSLPDTGVIKPILDRTFPLEAGAEAISYVESGHAVGKVVIRVGD